MGEYRSLLERAAAYVDARPDVFERLTLARTRRRRNKRIVAGVLAVALAAAGTSLAYVSFQHPGTRAPASTVRTADPRILWPSPGQATSDCCRTPWATARAFARTELGWSRVLVAERRDLSLGPRGRFFTILPCSAGKVCSASAFLITMARVPRADDPAAWSIVKVSTETTSITLRPGATVRADPLRVPVRMPRGLRIYAGMSFSGHHGPCGIADVVTAHHGSIELTGARVIHTCDGVSIGFPANGTVFLCAACHAHPQGATGGGIFGLLRSLSPPGPLSGFALVPVRFLAPSRTAASPTPRSSYPRGAFQWCPDPQGTLPFGKNGSRRAERVALRFSRAFLKHQQVILQRLADPSARPHLNQSVWAITGKPGRIRVLSSSPARKDPLVTFGCGRLVASRSVAVTIDDGTSSASLDFTVYLVRRADGWKVWATY